MKSHHIVSKGQKLKVRQFQALSLSEKKVIKKNPAGGVGLNLRITDTASLFSLCVKQCLNVSKRNFTPIFKDAHKRT